MPSKFQVVDCQTGKVIGTYLLRSKAMHKADVLDLEYGAVRYRVVAVYAE